MSVDREKVWLEQAKKLLEGEGSPAFHELPPFTLSMLTYFYGANSPQVKTYTDGVNNIAKGKDSRINATFLHAHGTLSSVVRELENGLIGSLRVPIQGEVLGDFVGLAKDALAENTVEMRNVAAVLTAASFEDCIRRLGTEKAGVVGRPKLEAVLIALKDAQILKGGNLSLANSMLKFRNDSLHADWQQVTKAQIESCLSLTEALLIEHFS